MQGAYYDRDVSKLQSLNEEVFALGAPEFVYLDISVGSTDEDNNNKDEKKKKVGRVVIQLASAALPTTCANFKALCCATPSPPNSTNNDEGGDEIGYLHTKAHLIDKTVGIAFGDVLHNNGISGKCHPSISSPSTFSFPDEPKVLTHCTQGMVSMLSPGVHSNDSRFLIQIVDDAPHLDGRYVSFGRVVENMDFLMENVVKGVFTKRGRPTVDVKIIGCGVYEEGEDKVAA